MLKGLRILFFCFFIGTNFKDTHCVFADHYDVKMPCHLILSKLADKCPSFSSQPFLLPSTFFFLLLPPSPSPLTSRCLPIRSWPPPSPLRGTSPRSFVTTSRSKFIFFFLFSYFLLQRPSFLPVDLWFSVLNIFFVFFFQV